MSILNRGLVLGIVATVLSTNTGAAQNASAQDEANGPDRAVVLRKDIERLKKQLSSLEDQLADEEKRQQEAAEQQERQRQEAKRLHSQDAGESDPDKEAAASPAPVHHSVERNFAANLFSDQKRILSSPYRLRVEDAKWVAPFGAITIGLIGSDTSIERELPSSPTTISHAKTFSDFAVAGLAGTAGAAYLWGRATNNDHLKETGFLSTEAFASSFLDAELIKFAAGRQRPLEGNGKGEFLKGGASFPSEHSAAAWSIASVIAHEYPGPMTKLFAYGTATAVTAARVIARQHFSSDVFIGSALGWYTGMQVYRAHHNPELGGSEWGRFQRSQEPTRPADMGSTYVPLDSWVYPSLERLAALGWVRTGLVSLRPWTRMECARQLREAQERVANLDRKDPAVRLVGALADEFRFESSLLDGGRNVGAQIDSIYMRWTQISGPPLHDSYHFAQSLVNDFGRPYAEGFNYITGVSGHAEAGPVAFFMQGEYQHAPSAPALPLAASQIIPQLDQMPAGFAPPPDIPSPSVNRLRLVNAYVAVNISDWQLSFGKQSLWWGPERSGPMALSDNAEPITMLRVARPSPFRLPGPFKLMGPVRTEFFIGQLEGQQIIQGPSGFVGQYGVALNRQPYIHGQKISFKPTPNFEISFSRHTIFAGGPYPLTWGKFENSMFSTGNTVAGNESKPGDRQSFLDFTYRIPKLRDWLTFYADGFADDQYSPVAYWDRSAWTAGLYMPRLPKLPQVDFRVEGLFTDIPVGGYQSRGFFYFNYTWRSGVTNNGNLLGSWVGRQGQGAQSWLTYHFTPQSFVEANFRHLKVSQDFVPGGGTVTDATINTAYWVRPEWGISGMLQWERWNFPILAAAEQTNVTTSVQITFRPREWKKRQSSNAATVQDH